MISDKINGTVEKILAEVSDINVLSTTGIIRILPHVVKLVDQFKELRGFEKKQLVMNTLSEIVNRLSPGDSEVQQSLEFIQQAGETLIDIYVFAARSKDMIKKTHSKLNACLKSCTTD
jgi:hypothetical protein